MSYATAQASCSAYSVNVSVVTGSPPTSGTLSGTSKSTPTGQTTSSTAAGPMSTNAAVGQWMTGATVSGATIGAIIAVLGGIIAL